MKIPVDTEAIERILASSHGPDEKRILEILARAEEGEVVTLQDAAALLQTGDPELTTEIIESADRLKKRYFAKTVTLFAPLYLSNKCTNDCLYCGFRKSNNLLPRRALTVVDIYKEARYLELVGFRRILLVLGDEPRQGIDYIVDGIATIFSKTGIKTVHVNAPALDTESCKKMLSAGAELYQVFQETYHRPTYEVMHPAGSKADYVRRIGAMGSALEAGFKKIGLGTLLGLYDYRFDVLSTIAHARHLTSRYGPHAQAISVPRLKPAAGSALEFVPRPVTDDELKKTVAIYRLALAGAGITISTRETPALRDELLGAGASHMSAASCTEPGGYTRAASTTLAQFKTFDHRSIEEVMAAIVKHGAVPSLVAACDSGDGANRNLHTANAILSVNEFLLDHKEKDIRKTFQGTLDTALDEIEDPSLKQTLLKRIERLENGERNIYFG